MKLVVFTSVSELLSVSGSLAREPRKPSLVVARGGCCSVAEGSARSAVVIRSDKADGACPVMDRNDKAAEESLGSFGLFGGFERRWTE